jgi:hypothetical protein
MVQEQTSVPSVTGRVFSAWREGLQMAHRDFASRICVRNAAESGKPDPTRMTLADIHRSVRHYTLGQIN